MIPIFNVSTKPPNFSSRYTNDVYQVLLCDLTHISSGQLSSNVFPLGVGLVGSYILKSDIGAQFEIELFKYPSDLAQHLLTNPLPAVIGFANYSWTLEISVTFARRIKEISPKTIVVFGGPNYGLSDSEMKNFWDSYGDCIDFNIVLEGEMAFYLLMRSLLQHDFNMLRVKNNLESLRNVHFLSINDELVKSELTERLNIDNLPSPYLDTTLMEKFFDGKLIPLTHSTRGCPFKCTFCSEGAEYYNKVKQRTSRISEEYRYIAQRSISVGMYDLMLSDANYGMFNEDSVRSSELAKVQEEFGYPKSVFVSTGKNQKARVLSAVKKLGGAIQLSASLQTTNEKVLQNIERSNISIDVLASAAREATDNDVASYSELILGLPGETLSTHVKSILDVADAGFSNIRIYQLILLPQTPLNTSEMRRTYNFKTKFRPMPRSYGSYEIFDKPFFVVEYEEIVIATSTLSYEEYLIARKTGLMVELVHNGRIFFEVMRLLSVFRIPWCEFLDFVFSKISNDSLPVRLSKFLDNFIGLMAERLYETKELLIDSISGTDAQEILVRLTTNELASTKALIIISEFELLNEFVYSSLREFLTSKKVEVSFPLINHLERFSLQSKSVLFDHLKITKFSVSLNEEDEKKFLYCADVSENYISSDEFKNREFLLGHDSEQTNEILRLLELYGDDEEGYARIVMRAPIIDKLFRRFQYNN
jgi:radical SAM superfamily enzyme YgiQ (UPF0313 family)